MNKPQRLRYFGLWNRACECQDWESKDADQRRAVTRAATGTESSTGLDEHQITALFAYLGHLAGDVEATDLWHRIERQGDRAANLQRQGEHYRKAAGYRRGGKLDMDRFRKLGDGMAAPEMTEEEAERYRMTMRSRARRKEEA